MNKKTLRIITVIATIVLCVSMSTISFAIDPSNVNTKSGELTDDATNTIVTTGGKIAGYISTVAIVISVIVLMILGVKYLIGSAEQKAEYKKSFIPYIVGAVLVFGAGTIATIVFNAASSV